MEQLISYLKEITGDVFKLLPMKEDELKGVNNHLKEYLESLTVNMNGALKTYSQLVNEKEYLYVINNLNYIYTNEVDFAHWRTIILNSVRGLSNLHGSYSGE
jgi:hypothetical protein